MPGDTAATLETLMGAYYKADHLSQGTKAAALTAFSNAVDKDPALEPLARSELTRLRAMKIPEQRCTITATKVDFLTRALNQ